MDQPILANDIACWHRQGPRCIAVVSFQVDAEGAVNFAQRHWQRKNQAELSGKGIVLVSQYRYG